MTTHPLSILVFEDLLQFLHTHSSPNASWSVSFQIQPPIQNLIDLLIPSAQGPPMSVTWIDGPSQLELHLYNRTIRIRTDSISFVERCRHLSHGRGISTFQVDFHHQ